MAKILETKKEELKDLKEALSVTTDTDEKAMIQEGIDELTKEIALLEDAHKTIPKKSVLKAKTKESKEKITLSVGQLVKANTGVELKVLEFDKSFGGRFRAERTDGSKSYPKLWNKVSILDFSDDSDKSTPESKTVDLNAKSQMFNGHKLEKIDGGWELKVSETEQYCIKKKANGKWAIIHGKATDQEFDSPSDAFDWLQKSVYKGTVKKLIEEKQEASKKKKESQEKYEGTPTVKKIENTLEKTADSVENRVEEIKEEGDSLSSKETTKMFSEIKDTIQHITDGIKATIERKKAVAGFITQLAKAYGIKVEMVEKFEKGGSVGKNVRYDVIDTSDDSKVKSDLSQDELFEYVEDLYWYDNADVSDEEKEGFVMTEEIAIEALERDGDCKVVKKFEKGGSITKKEFLKDSKALHKAISEITLKSGEKVSGKEVMAVGGTIISNRAMANDLLSMDKESFLAEYPSVSSSEYDKTVNNLYKSLLSNK